MRALVIGALLVGVTGCGGRNEPDGGRLPDIELSPLTSNGTPLDLGELEGPAVINLWATWCAPCRRELPDFEVVSAERTDVQFIGVDIGEDPDGAQDFIDELGVSFEQYADQAGDLTDAIGVASLPITLVVDGDGEISTNHLGPMSADDLRTAIDAATG